jgi:hypothetical protein
MTKVLVSKKAPSGYKSKKVETMVKPPIKKRERPIPIYFGLSHGEHRLIVQVTTK